VGAEHHGALQGFALVRLISGEFGTAGTIAVLDAIGVCPEAQGQGVGRALMKELDRIARSKKVDGMHTQAAWVNQDLMRFLASVQFAPAPRMILARAVEGPVDW
jgi:GNAT superfamily N-acetyltransferase